MTVVDTDRLVALASELVMRVREVDPERNRTWLASLTAEERFALLFVLAAMVDPDVPLPVLLGWTNALGVPGG